MTLQMYGQEKLQEGLEQGLKQGLEQGLQALVCSLKPMFSSFDDLYHAVIQNQAYSSCTKEQVRKYYN